MNNPIPSSIFRLSFFALLPFVFACREKTSPQPLPVEYQQSGAFVKTLPYFNPDSCLLLVRQHVPKQWQSAAYKSLFLDGPEDSPIELGLKHLDVLGENFPTDSMLAFVQHWRGRLYYLQSKTAEAIRAYLAAQEIIERLDNCPQKFKYSNLESLFAAYNQSGNGEEALRWQQKLLDLASTDTSRLGISYQIVALLQKSVYYWHKKLPDSSMLAAQTGLDLNQKHNTSFKREDLLRLLGIAHLQKKDCATALGLFHQAKAMQKQGYRFTNPLNIEMGKAYLCLGKLDSAEILFNILRQSAFPIDVNQALWHLGTIHAKKGQYKAAFEALEAKVQLTEKFYNPEKIQEMGAAKVQLELERAERQAAEEAAQKRAARQQMLIISLALLFALGFLLSLFLRQRSQRRILEQEKEILEKDKTLLEQKSELAEAYALLQAQELEHSQQNLQRTQAELNEAALLLELKNELVEELQMRLHSQSLTPEETDTNMPGTSRQGVSGDLYRMKILTDDDWQNFRDRFSAHFPNFMMQIKSQFPDMTAAEMRLFMLSKLHFSTKEMSETLGISLDSVYKSRTRLAKSLNLEGGAAALGDFVQQFS